MATKPRKKLLRNECVSPPRDIQEKTKERREWLATKLAEINRQPNREGRIVGKGSYQSISVYEVTEVEGRLRHRGACQCCGHYQVVQRGRLVNHGYKRPGDGYLIGRCPGVDLAPLNTEKKHTEAWLAQAIEDHEAAKVALQSAEAAKTEASNKLYGGSDRREPEAHTFKPKSLPERPTPTEEQRRAYAQAFSEWSKQFPLTAGYLKASKSYELCRQFEWQTREARRHFQYLIDSEIHGKPLQDEIAV